MTITRTDILDRLVEQGIRYSELCLDGGATILISEQGGRIFGPFTSPEAASVYWVNPDFASPSAFSKLLRESWNLGGERLWVAPELQYLVRDRNDYFGSLFIPPDLDPGKWRLEASPTKCHLEKELHLEAFNLSSGETDLKLSVDVFPVANPLRRLGKFDALMEGVIFSGYQQSVTLQVLSGSAIASSSWNLIQLDPGGVLVIPCTPVVETTLYKGSLEGGYQTIKDGAVHLRITADQMYKTGYKAAHVYGRVGYFNHTGDGQAYLLVRCFSNQPSAEYMEEPPEQPGRQGDSIHVYNDDSGFGVFGEMECSGQAVGGQSGRTSSTDQFTLWAFWGPSERLRQIALNLLGVQL